MPTLNVHIKHAGKVYDLPLNTDAPASIFKEAVYQVTGVPVERMKVMIKGGVLKNDTDWRKVALKEGQTFMVVGAAGELPKPPETPVVFLEDLDDTSLAQALALPVGLRNLGNTCYMNATLQTMRAIPELQAALNAYTGSSAAGQQGGQNGHPILARSLRDLFANMRSTTGPVTPMSFLSVLRQVVPQFGEMARTGKSSIPGLAAYAQQDAVECWVEVSNALKALPGAPSPSSQDSTSDKRFVDQYMMSEIRQELKCDDAPDEPVQVSTQKGLYIECNISHTTNYMHTGIADSLNQTITKNSPTLGREANYSAKLRLSRIPANLTVLMVRFAWKREINKKAKIMRRVKFPLEFDVLDLCTDELKQKLLPVNTKLKEFERDRAERRKVRRRTKIALTSGSDANTSSSSSSVPRPTADVEMTDASLGAATPVAGPEAPVLPPPTDFASPTAAEKGKSAVPSPPATAGAALEPESVYRARELAELETLVPAEFREDVGCSVTGLYELVGIVAHKGAAADSGHYIGFVKKTAMYAARKAAEGGSEEPELDENDEDWYKFDDEKVSVFPVDKLQTLEGGGEDASAYVLLYRSKPLA